jgi:hypothetical protein
MDAYKAYCELFAKPNHVKKEKYLRIIKKDAHYAYLYAKDVVGGRWEQGEESIKTDAYCSYNYANDVIGRWKEGEEIIKTDAGWAYHYARDVIKGRWIEAEDIIKKHIDQAIIYARDVIKGRWIEAEDIIKKHIDHAIIYARDVIKGRWKEAEENIKSSTAIFRYCKNLDQRVIELEHLLKGRSKIDYYLHFKLPLPEEDYNKEIANGIIGKNSKYLQKINKEKNLAKKHIRNLIKFGIISEDQKISEIINN